MASQRAQQTQRAQKGSKKTMKRNEAKYKAKLLREGKPYTPPEECIAAKTARARQVAERKRDEDVRKAETSPIISRLAHTPNPPLHARESARLEHALQVPDEEVDVIPTSKTLSTIEPAYHPFAWRLAYDSRIELLQNNMVVKKTMKPEACYAAWHWGFVEYRSFDLHDRMVRFYYEYARTLMSNNLPIDPLYIAFVYAVQEAEEENTSFIRRREFVDLWRKSPAGQDFFRLSDGQVKKGFKAIKEHRQSIDEFAKKEAAHVMQSTADEAHHLSRATADVRKASYRQRQKTARALLDDQVRLKMQEDGMDGVETREDCLAGVEGEEAMMELDQTDGMKKLTTQAKRFQVLVDDQTNEWKMLLTRVVAYLWVSVKYEVSLTEEEKFLDDQAFEKEMAKLSIA